MTWIIAHSPSPIGSTQGLTIRPCYTERGAKTHAREQVANGHVVSAQTLEGVNPPRRIKSQDVFKWLAERDRR